MRYRRLPFVFLVTLGLPGQQVSQRSRDWPCSGGRAVDPSYAAVAEGSGGHLYMLDPSEITQSGSLMAWHLKHTETIFRAMGELSKQTREFTFPVDSTVDSLVLTISLQCKDSVSILDASGAPANGDQIDFRAGKALRVLRPAPGMWKLRVSGTGLFFVTAEAVSELSLDAVRFVEHGGRPGHEGLFPIKGPPILGAAALLGFDLGNAPHEGVRLRMIDSAGQTLDAAEVQPLAPASYLAQVVLRHAAFRIVVEGVDQRGWPFQRMHGPLTVAEAPPRAAGVN